MAIHKSNNDIGLIAQIEYNFENNSSPSFSSLAKKEFLKFNMLLFNSNSLKTLTIFSSKFIILLLILILDLLSFF